MGIFFPWNWPSEVFVLPLLVLSCASVLLALHVMHSFLRPTVSLKTAREKADQDRERLARGLEQTTKRLQTCRENESQQLDKVFKMAQEHIRSNITRDEAALLTTDAIGLHDWGSAKGLAKLCIEHRQSAAERTDDAQESHDKTQGSYDEALARHQELQQCTEWNYRKHEFKNRKWRDYFKAVLRSAFWLFLCLYGFTVLGADIRTWEQEARSAVGQDEIVVDVSYILGGTNTVTVDRGGCQITYAIDVHSSTDYDFIGHGQLHMEIHEEHGKYIAPCLEWLNK